MDITFDPAKNKANIAKHGVSLADAALIEWDYMVSKADMREDYNEERIVGFAPIGERIYCVVYTPRGDALRIISLRKANRREILDYENNV